MTISFDTFERYKQKGLDARRAGQWDSARVYLLEAARAMVELGKQATTAELKDARQQTAAKLLELARDCERSKNSGRKSPAHPPSTIHHPQSESDGGNASDWIVREKPKMTFDDVAGLDEVKKNGKGDIQRMEKVTSREWKR